MTVCKKVNVRTLAVMIILIYKIKGVALSHFLGDSGQMDND